MSNRITHIRKPNVSSIVEHITHVKGTTSEGKTFELTVPQVVEYLKKGNYYFYVQVGTRQVAVTHQRVQQATNISKQSLILPQRIIC